MTELEKLEQMRRCVVFDPRIDKLNLLVLNLRCYTDITIEGTTDPKEIFSSSGLIFFDEKNKVKIYEQLNKTPEKKFEWVLLLTTDNNAPMPEFVQKMEYNASLRDIIRFVAKKFHVTSKKMAALDVGPYFLFDRKYLLPGSILSTDCIKSPNDSEIFLKKGSILTQQHLKELETGIFVPSQKRLNVVQTFTDSLHEQLAKKTLSSKERNHLTYNSFSMIAEQLGALGPTESTQELVQSSLLSLDTLIVTNPKLDKFLNAVSSEPTSFSYRHSVLSAFFGTKALTALSMDSQKTINQFVSCAFLHDIMLSDDSWHQFESDEQVDLSSLDERSKNIIKNHAVMAAKLVSQFKKMPFDLDTLIKQHHGNKHGNSLNSITISISPLSIIFCVTEFFTHYYLDHIDQNKKMDKNEFEQKANAKFSFPNFKKHISLFLDFI